MHDATAISGVLEKAPNIVLIGMPGAGKSTLGTALAPLLGYTFIDADALIQAQCDKTLQKIIESLGSEGFIQIENEILRDIEAQRSIISTGGSAVYSDEAMQHLATLGPVVYLQISYEQLKERLHDFDQHERGIVLKNGIGTSLHDLYEERLPLYEHYADITVNVTNLTIEKAASAVINAIAAYETAPV